MKADLITKAIRLPGNRVRRDKDAKVPGFSPRLVLVPIDFSPFSDAALRRAQQIAQQFGSKLHLLHVVEPIIHPIEFMIVPPEMEEVNRRPVLKRKARLEEIRKRLRAEGLSCRAEVRVGNPWRTIVDYAKSSKCDLIVVATHGRAGLNHLVMGSTAERIVQHAPCSVLVVR